MAGISPRDLKLVAFDAQDLAILSLHLQDAVLQVADMAYLPRERRFAAIVNRFDWAKAIAAAEQTAGKPGPRGKPYVRHRTALRFEHVTGAKLSGIDPKARRQALSLLALLHPNEGLAAFACMPVGLIIGYWLLRRRVHADLEGGAPAAHSASASEAGRP